MHAQLAHVAERHRRAGRVLDLGHQSSHRLRQPNRPAIAHKRPLVHCRCDPATRLDQSIAWRATRLGGCLRGPFRPHFKRAIPDRLTPTNPTAIGAPTKVR